MSKVIITAAVTGSRPTKEMNPALPYTPEEIAQAAIECRWAGAAIAHIHVRDPQTGRPAFALDLFAKVVDRIRQASDVLINLTTSGLFLEGQGPKLIEQRLEPITLHPELCSFDIGSMNFRNRAFVNPPAWGERATQAMRAQGVKPEIEVFEPGHIEQARHYVNRGLLDDPPYFQLCMGAQWGIAGTPEDLLFMKNKLPAGAQWSVLGVGAAQLPMITMGLLLGGHIRVGLEDNIYLRRGVLAESNAQMVAMAVELARQLQREPATPDEAREILGIGVG